MNQRSRGRPRSESVDRAVLDATMRLLAEVGLAGVTIEAIAAHAGVGRPTVYRRWQTREEIVVAALVDAVRPLDDADTGDTRQDLYAMLTGLMHDLNSAVGPAVLGVHAALRPGSALAKKLRERYLGPRDQRLTTVLRRGADRGELRRDIDPAVIRDLIFGPPIYHLLITGSPMADDLMRTAFELVWQAIARPAAAPPAR